MSAMPLFSSELYGLSSLLIWPTLAVCIWLYSNSAPRGQRFDCALIEHGTAEYATQMIVNDGYLFTVKKLIHIWPTAVAKFEHLNDFILQYSVKHFGFCTDEESDSTNRRFIGVIRWILRDRTTSQKRLMATDFIISSQSKIVNRQRFRFIWVESNQLSELSLKFWRLLFEDVLGIH